jgi:hypothetical protein
MNSRWLVCHVQNLQDEQWIPGDWSVMYKIYKMNNEFQVTDLSCTKFTRWTMNSRWLICHVQNLQDEKWILGDYFGNKKKKILKPQ